MLFEDLNLADEAQAIRDVVNASLAEVMRLIPVFVTVFCHSCAIQNIRYINI